MYTSYDYLPAVALRAKSCLSASCKRDRGNTKSHPVSLRTASSNKLVDVGKS